MRLFVQRYNIIICTSLANFSDIFVHFIHPYMNPLPKFSVLNTLWFYEQLIPFLSLKLFFKYYIDQKELKIWNSWSFVPEKINKYWTICTNHLKFVKPKYEKQINMTKIPYKIWLGIFLDSLFISFQVSNSLGTIVFKN